MLVQVCSCMYMSLFVFYMCMYIIIIDMVFCVLLIVLIKYIGCRYYCCPCMLAHVCMYVHVHVTVYVLQVHAYIHAV